MRVDHLPAGQARAGTRAPCATRIAVSVVGTYAGLLGAAHGFFEIRQGALVPANIAINAIGAPCQPQTAAHACWPALTLIPNLRTSGSLAILISLAVLAWSAFFITRERRRPILFMLALVLLVVGGGFLPPIYAMMAATAATQIDTAGRWWRARLSDRALIRLATLWPRVLVAYFAWVAIQAFFSGALNTFLLGIGPLIVPVELGVLALSIISAFAYDIHQTTVT